MIIESNSQGGTARIMTAANRLGLYSGGQSALLFQGIDESYETLPRESLLTCVSGVKGYCIELQAATKVDGGNNIPKFDIF